MISLYLDEDSEAHALAEGLRRAGIDVVRTSDAGNRSKTDREQLEYATAAGRVIVTANVRDFSRLNAEWMAAGRLHGGILIRSQGLGVGEDLRRILRMEAEADADELRGTVAYLARWGG